MYVTLENEQDLENEDNLKNEDNHKNEDNLRNEDNPILQTGSNPNTTNWNMIIIQLNTTQQVLHNSTQCKTFFIYFRIQNNSTKTQQNTIWRQKLLL